jgi:hypothetical protein
MRIANGYGKLKDLTFRVPPWVRPPWLIGRTAGRFRRFHEARLAVLLIWKTRIMYLEFRVFVF